MTIINHAILILLIFHNVEREAKAVVLLCTLLEKTYKVMMICKPSLIVELQNYTEAQASSYELKLIHTAWFDFRTFAAKFGFSNSNLLSWITL